MLERYTTLWMHFYRCEIYQLFYRPIGTITRTLEAWIHNLLYFLVIVRLLLACHCLLFRNWYYFSIDILAGFFFAPSDRHNVRPLEQVLPLLSMSYVIFIAVCQHILFMQMQVGTSNIKPFAASVHLTNLQEIFRLNADQIKYLARLAREFCLLKLSRHLYRLWTGQVKFKYTKRLPKVALLENEERTRIFIISLLSEVAVTCTIIVHWILNIILGVIYFRLACTDGSHRVLMLLDYLCLVHLSLITSFSLSCIFMTIINISYIFVVYLIKVNRLITKDIKDIKDNQRILLRVKLFMLEYNKMATILSDCHPQWTNIISTFIMSNIFMINVYLTVILIRYQSLVTPGLVILYWAHFIGCSASMIVAAYLSRLFHQTAHPLGAIFAKRQLRVSKSQLSLQWKLSACYECVHSDRHFGMQCLLGTITFENIFKAIYAYVSVILFSLQFA